MKQPAHMTPGERAKWLASLPKTPPWPLLNEERLRHYNRIVVEAIRDAGMHINSVSDLIIMSEPYTKAIPTLIEQAYRLGNSCKEERAIHREVIRALSVPEAKGAGAELMLYLFKQTASDDHSFGWQIANALTVLAEDRHFDIIVTLIALDKYGHARSPLPEALRTGDRNRLVGAIRPLLGVVPFQWSSIDAAKRYNLTELRDDIERAYRDSEDSETYSRAQSVIRHLDKVLKRGDL